MSVLMLRDCMPNEEFLYWGIYYGREAQRRELAMKQGSVR